MWFEDADGRIISVEAKRDGDQEKESEQRLRDFAGFQVNEELMRMAPADALFLHCLPAHRGEEISASVFEGPHSAVWKQAAHRLTAMRGILAWSVEETT